MLVSTFVEATQVTQRRNRYWGRTQSLSGISVQLAQDKKERQPCFMSPWKKKTPNKPVLIKKCMAEIKNVMYLVEVYYSEKR